MGEIDGGRTREAVELDREIQYQKASYLLGQRSHPGQKLSGTLSGRHELKHETWMILHRIDEFSRQRGAGTTVEGTPLGQVMLRRATASIMLL